MTEDTSQLVGRTVDGRYRIEERIGAGGMGEVYRARQINVRRDVAIKVLHRERLGDEQAIQQFVEEALAVSQLRSPHSVTLIDVGQLGEEDAFLVMELVEGRTLRQLLAERVPGVDETVDIVEAIAQALGEAHARGIVHRDIKPSNVMLARTPGHDAFVKVLDYGLAAPIGDEQRLAGTPAYMAPEVIAEGICTPQSDVYALGILTFELLTGAPPFEGSTEAILEAQLHDEPPLEEAELPKRVRKLLARCLSKHPQLRPDDASVFRRALLRAVGRPHATPREDATKPVAMVGGETLTTMASLRGSAPPEPSIARRRWRWGVAAAALAVGAWIGLSGDDANAPSPSASMPTAVAHGPATPSATTPATSAPATSFTALPSASAAGEPSEPEPSTPAHEADAPAKPTATSAPPPKTPPTSPATPSATADAYGERLDKLLPPTPSASAAPPDEASAKPDFDDKVDAILD